MGALADGRDPGRGEKVFQYCYSCHSVQPRATLFSRTKRTCRARACTGSSAAGSRRRRDFPIPLPCVPSPNRRSAGVRSSWIATSPPRTSWCRRPAWPSLALRRRTNVQISLRICGQIVGLLNAVVSCAPSGTQEGHRDGGHEHRHTRISQDCRPEARDTDDGDHQAHRLEDKRHRSERRRKSVLIPTGVRTKKPRLRGERTGCLRTSASRTTGLG
jgi:hypothetical protein